MNPIVILERYFLSIVYLILIMLPHRKIGRVNGGRIV